MIKQHVNPILGRTTAVEETAYSHGDWSIVRCCETEFVFLASPPEYSQLETEYAWEKTADAERNRRESSAPLMSRVSTLMKKLKTLVFSKRNKMAQLAIGELLAQRQSKPVRVLDIGCGVGNLMVEICNRSKTKGQTVVPIGIEVSRRLAQLAEERFGPLGGKVHCANAFDAMSAFEPGSIQLVVMSSFLEHEAQPLHLLNRLRSVLATEGSIVLKVPNFACWNRRLRGKKWCGFRYPDHVNYFTPLTLNRLAEEAQFRVSRQTFIDKIPLSDNMYAVLSKKSSSTDLPRSGSC